MSFPSVPLITSKSVVAKGKDVGPTSVPNVMPQTSVNEVFLSACDYFLRRIDFCFFSGLVPNAVQSL